MGTGGQEQHLGENEQQQAVLRGYLQGEYEQQQAVLHREHHPHHVRPHPRCSRCVR